MIHRAQKPSEDDGTTHFKIEGSGKGWKVLIDGTLTWKSWSMLTAGLLALSSAIWKIVTLLLEVNK